MRDDEFRANLKRVLNTEAGRLVFRQLVKDFNFNQATNRCLSSTGEVNVMALVNNEGIRSFWVELRKHVEYEHLILIEYDPPQPTTEDESCQKIATQETPEEPTSHKQRTRDSKRRQQQMEE